MYSELQVRKESGDILKFIEISKLNLLVRRIPTCKYIYAHFPRAFIHLHISLLL